MMFGWFKKTPKPEHFHLCQECGLIPPGSGVWHPSDLFFDSAFHTKKIERIIEGHDFSTYERHYARCERKESR